MTGIPPGIPQSLSQTLPTQPLPTRLIGAPGLKSSMVFESPAQSLSLFSSGNGFQGKRNQQKIPVQTQGKLSGFFIEVISIKGDYLLIVSEYVIST